MRTKLLVFVSVLMIASMALAACAPAAAPTAPPAQIQTVVVTQEGKTVVVTATPEPPKEVAAPKSKDPTTLVDMTFGDPETLFPALAYDTSSGGVIMNTYDTLIWYKKDSVKEFVPLLASEVPTAANGGISADGLTYTFKIRPGVKFHSGEDLTPSDVAYSLQQGILSGGTASPQWLLVEPILGSSASNDIGDQITEADMTKAGVKPEDGVVDNRDNMKKIDPATLKAVCENVKSHIVADDKAGTVTVKLSQPWGPFVVTLAGSWGAIRQQKWSAANGAWDGDCATWQNFYAPSSEEVNKSGIGTKENGTGPYILDKWTPKESINYKANENYFVKEPLWEGGPSGAPKLKSVIVKEVDEFSTRFAAFQAGDADFIAAGSPENWPQLDTLAGETCDPVTFECKVTDPNKAVRVFTKVRQASRTDAFMNFKVNTTGGNSYIGSGKLDGNGIPPNFFEDIHVRKGFAYCFDWDTYIKDVQMGEGVQADAMMLKGEIGSSDKNPVYKYDPDKCKAELAASTWKENGKDPKTGETLYVSDPAGTIKLADIGFRLTVVYNTGNTARQSVAQIWQQNLSAVDPKYVVEVLGLPWPAYLQAYKAKKFPFFIIGWQEDIPDPHNWTFTYAGGGGAYSNKQGMPQAMMDQFAPLITSGVKESDPAKRQAIYEQLNQLFYDNIPTVLLAQAYGRHYEQRWVKGYYNNPIYSDFWFYQYSKD